MEIVKISAVRGPKLIAVIAIVLCFVAYRFVTLGATDDPALKAAVREALANELGAAVSQAIAQAKSDNNFDTLSKMGDRDSIIIHSLSLSKPLLSLSSSQRAIVYVEYSLPGEEHTIRSEYYEFSDSLIGGWQYRWDSSSFMYYSNFF